MGATQTKADRIDRCIESISTALREHSGQGVPAVERRKLRTVVAACGCRGTAQALKEIQERFRTAGLYSDPILTDSALKLDHFVRFSTGPFPPDSMFFPKERDLQRFVEACLGTTRFRGLKAYRSNGRTGREFLLDNGKKVDLLCEEQHKSGPGALVAIELKREHERGSVAQVVEYINALRQMFPGREVKGKIISGREDQVTATMLQGLSGYDIEWLCYEVSFKTLATSSKD